MILTGKAKEDFEKGIIEILNQNYNAKICDNKRAISWIYDSNDLILLAHIIEWFDSVGIYINIEPHVGGGDVVFYFGVINRRADFIDEHYSSVNDDIYFGTRQEALTEAIKKANEIYNEKN